MTSVGDWQVYCRCRSDNELHGRHKVVTVASQSLRRRSRNCEQCLMRSELFEKNSSVVNKDLTFKAKTKAKDLTLKA